MDPEFRQRKPINENNNLIEDANQNILHGLHKQDSNFEGFESDEERIIDDKTIEDIKKAVPQGSDVSCLDKFLSHLPSKWKNYVIRSIFTLFMVFGFFTFIYLGPLALAGITIFVQVKCFSEIISVGYAVYRVHGLPWFRSLSWYFLVTSNYFFYGESFSKSDFFDVYLLKKASFLYILVKYHRFISFTLYIIGILWFVLSLKKRYYMRQFSLFAWTHVTLLIVVTQSYLILQNLFQGLIWFIAPVSMIVINDVMAYLFGFFFGKTPLIKLSPKKTWEGFIGGGIATVILGALLSHALCQYPYFVCPVEYSFEHGFKQVECRLPHLFQLTEYELPTSLSSILQMAKLPPTITLYPFVLHSLALSMFSSILAPFGGFFASGFKRAFKIKDFGDIIPGHGGIMDRFDCQFLMATFVNVYISSFISAPNPDTILQQINQLKTEHQIIIFEALKKSLQEQQIL